MALNKITVVKIGGNVIDNSEALARFVKAFAAIEGAKILIHGGGKLATRMAERMEIPVQMVEGRRITDKATLDIVTMVYAGLVNKQLVASLQGAGCNALGLSGADGHIVKAHRRRPNPIDYGFVGDIDAVDGRLLETLLEAGITPVFSAIMYDGERSLLNCNADNVAEGIARGAATLAPTDLVFCFEKRGVLRDADDENSVIARITPTSYPPLKSDGTVKGGMIPKIENALKAIAAGVRSVQIKHADDLLCAGGTTICND